MCGRYLAYSEDDNQEILQIIREVEIKFPRLFREGEIFPTNQAPVLIAGHSRDVVATLMPWGYPKWDGKGQIINARAETVLDKPMFKGSARCIVPTCGFYEWRAEGKPKKTKYLFRLPHSPALYLTGLCKEIKGQLYFTIITTGANPTIREYHDRMPLVINKNKIMDWLTDDKFVHQHLAEPCLDRLVATVAT